MCFVIDINDPNSPGLKMTIHASYNMYAFIHAGTRVYAWNKNFFVGTVTRSDYVSKLTTLYKMILDCLLIGNGSAV